MQLVLAEKFFDLDELRKTPAPDRNVEFTVDKNVISGSLLGYKKRKQGRDLNDEGLAAKKLVSEIIKNGYDIESSSSLLIKITPIRNTKVAEISLTSHDPERSILKSLVQKFQDKVKMYVYLKYHHYERIFDFASIKGIKIDAKTFTCVGTCNATYMAFSIDDHWCHSPPRPSPKMHVKLVADIDASVLVGVSFAQKLLDEGAFTDLTISTGNGTEIKAHKSFLSVCSPVLKAMFESEMKESRTGGVDMTGMTESGVRAFLRYVYYGDLKEPKENFQVAYDLLYASHMYEVPSLELDIESLLMETNDKDFNVAVAFKIYMFTRNIESFVELKTKAVRILKGKWNELEKLQEYNDLFKKPSNSKSQVFRDFCRDLALIHLESA